jgi:hypothetical protein
MPKLGEIRMAGSVVHVFRGSPLVQVGSVVSFPIWVCHKGDEPTGPAFVYHDDLLRKRYVEAYLSGQPPDFRLAGYECLLITTPSLEPQLPVDFAKLALPSGRGVSPGTAPRRRWWFWKK